LAVDASENVCFIDIYNQGIRGVAQQESDRLRGPEGEMKTFRVRVLGVGFVVALVWGAAVTGAGGSMSVVWPHSETLPAGFTDTVVAIVSRPVALAATPDGRILVVDQSGLVRVIQNGVLLAAPALDISAKVCATNSERGMLGIAVDPNFSVNGYVYIYYTFNKFSECKRLVNVPVNRVSRFTMSGDTISPASEKILIDNMLSYYGNHNAGDVGFGKDGMLYVSVGDGGCNYLVGPTACDQNNNTNAISLTLNTLQGKILRITPSGGIPTDNPFIGTGTARCNHGYNTAGQKCEEIYLYGLRNPFRFAFDPNSTRTRLFVNDTGQDTWEEIDKSVKGSNYGWNVREGPCAEGSLTDCGPPPPGMTNPILSYSHVAGCGAITGGAFVPNGLWGTSYDSGYLFADYVCNQIFLMVPNGTGGWTSSVFASGLAVGGPVTMTFAPYGTKTALYYTTYTANSTTGEVHVIQHT
jgi:glucose/arabinose dehydrogenase